MVEVRDPAGRLPGHEAGSKLITYYNRIPNAVWLNQYANLANKKSEQTSKEIEY